MSNKDLASKIRANQRMHGLAKTVARISSQTIETENPKSNKRSKMSNVDSKNKSARKSVNLMAFSKAIQNKGGNGGGELWYGYNNMTLVAVNPTKAEWERLTGRTTEKEFEYVGKDRNGNQQIRIDFVMRPNVEGDIQPNLMHRNIYLRKAPRYSKDNTKVLACDNMGNTAWVPANNINVKQVQKNDSNEMIDVRMGSVRHIAFNGEDELMNFCQCIMGFTGPKYNKDTKKWYVDDSLAETEALVFTEQEWNDIFNSKIDVLRDAVMDAAKLNDVCCIVNIETRVKEDGKTQQFSNIWSKVLKAGTGVKGITYEIGKVDEESRRRVSNGGTAIEYINAPLQIRQLTPTELQQTMLPNDENAEDGGLPF